MGVLRGSLNPKLISMLETTAIYDVDSKNVYFPIENDNPHGNHYTPSVGSAFSRFFNQKSSANSACIFISPTVSLPSSQYTTNIPPYVMLDAPYYKELTSLVKKESALFRGASGVLKNMVSSLNIMGGFFRYHAHLLVCVVVVCYCVILHCFVVTLQTVSDRR
jgi:hypothetical protein